MPSRIQRVVLRHGHVLCLGQFCATQQLDIHVPIPERTRLDEVLRVRPAQVHHFLRDDHQRPVLDRPQQMPHVEILPHMGHLVDGQVNYGQVGHGYVADGELEGESDGDEDGESDGLVEGESDGDVDGDVDGESDGEVDGLVEGDVEGEVDGELDADADGDDEDTTVPTLPDKISHR